MKTLFPGERVGRYFEAIVVSFLQHAIQIDFEHHDGIKVIGVAVVVVALAAALAMVRGALALRLKSGDDG